MAALSRRRQSRDQGRRPRPRGAAEGRPPRRRDRKRHAALEMDGEIRLFRVPHESPARARPMAGLLAQSSGPALAGRPGDAGDIATRLDSWGSFRPEFDYADGFHTFAVLWTPDRVIHYVDDVPVAERRFLWRHADGSDAGPAHILLNHAVGGAWPEAPTSAAEFPATLQVEYIRVWQK